jgi:hypothetical protein
VQTKEISENFCYLRIDEKTTPKEIREIVRKLRIDQD